MNCFQILGIESTKDKKAIKRAYARAVKLYHPEENPKGFERVHQAYQEALQYAAGNSVFNIQSNHAKPQSANEEKPRKTITTPKLLHDIYTVEGFINEVRRLFDEPEYWSDILEWQRLFALPIFERAKQSEDFLKMLADNLDDNCRLEMSVWDFLMPSLTGLDAGNSSLHWYEQEFQYAYLHRKGMEKIRETMIDLFHKHRGWKDKGLWVEFFKTGDFQKMRYNLSLFEIIKKYLKEKDDIHESIWRVILAAYSFEDTEASHYLAMDGIIRNIYLEQLKQHRISKEETQLDIALKKIKEQFGDPGKRNDVSQWQELFRDEIIQAVKKDKQFGNVLIGYAGTYASMNSLAFKYLWEELEPVNTEAGRILKESYERQWEKEKRAEIVNDCFEKSRKNRKSSYINKKISNFCFVACSLIVFVIWIIVAFFMHIHMYNL